MTGATLRTWSAFTLQRFAIATLYYLVSGFRSEFIGRSVQAGLRVSSYSGYDSCQPSLHTDRHQDTF